MRTEKRRYSRAGVKWPVIIQTPTGLIDGTTENLSLGGAYIRVPSQLNSSHNFSVVLNNNGRLIPCKAQVVWSDECKSSGKNKSLGIGVRFTRMMLNDRQFLHGQISSV